MLGPLRSRAPRSRGFGQGSVGAQCREPTHSPPDPEAAHTQRSVTWPLVRAAALCPHNPDES
jgi:hypothetical protein